MLLAARGAPPIAGLLGVHNVGPTLIAHGSEAHHLHLKPILQGEEIWCQGFSEPDAGSDLASLRTYAETSISGYVLNGRKVWATNGMDATHCMVLARTDREAPAHRGNSVLLVALNTPGVERRPIRQMDGAAEFAELTFDDVILAGDALVGTLNEGWRITMSTLSHERAGVISQAGGLESDARRLVDSYGHTASPICALRSSSASLKPESCD